MIWGMRAHFASGLHNVLLAQCRKLAKDNKWSEHMDNFLIVEPVDSSAVTWITELYPIIERNKLKRKINFRWNAKKNVSEKDLTFLCLQISSFDRKIEAINIEPFQSNFER
jgi:hypothetical protein